MKVFQYKVLLILTKLWCGGNHAVHLEAPLKTIKLSVTPMSNIDEFETNSKTNASSTQ